MKSAYRTVYCAFLCGLVLALENVSQAFVYNFENDFSKTTNTESSIWSYRWKDSFTRDGNYALLPSFHTNLPWAPQIPYDPIWTPSETQFYPWIGVNDSGGTIYDPVLDPGAIWAWPNGQSSIHPLGSPDGSALAVVSWLSPYNGTVNIGLRIADLDGRGYQGVEYYLDKGSALGNLASGIIPEGGDTGFFSIPDVPVSVGDRLNFIIGPNGSYYNDNTRMFVEITDEAIPEPSSFALLALGVTVVAIRLYRRGMRPYATNSALCDARLPQPMSSYTLTRSVKVVGRNGFEPLKA